MSPDFCDVPFPLPDAEAGAATFVALCAASPVAPEAHDAHAAAAAPRLPRGFSIDTLATLRRLAHERAAQGRTEDALALFRTVIDCLAPGRALALVQTEYAGALAHVLRHDEALVAFDAALGACGEDVDGRMRALAGKALSLTAAMRGEEALLLLERHAWLRAAARAADAPVTWDLALARVFLASRRPLEALDTVEQVLRHAPADSASLLAKATILLRMRRPMQAVGALEPVLEREPDHATALVLFGQALAALGEFAFAVDRFERALQVAPRHAPAYRYMAGALCMQGLDDAALVCLRAARALRPDWPLAWLDEAGIRLRRGELSRGFAAYEWRDGARWAARQGGAYWNGDEPIGTRSLLVLAEQGLGDTLQFVRYLPSVAKLARDVVVMVQPPLRRLLAAQAARWGVRIVSQDDARPDTDRFTLLMSLPHALGTRLDTIPADMPYLTAPAADGPRTDAPARPWRIGIVPSGNPHFVDDAWRSMPLAVFEPVLRLSGVEVTLLQPAPREADRQWAAAHAPALRMPALAGDFADTAAEVASLDLVISVDTAVAHLAGALGKPVWILLPYLADWRWMGERDDSPWYPSATLFRQTALHDWPGVMAAVREALATRVDAALAAGTDPALAARRRRPAPAVPDAPVTPACWTRRRVHGPRPRPSRSRGAREASAPVARAISRPSHRRR